jgi:phosphoribosylformylglycinamidine cyclo-ligase
MRRARADRARTSAGNTRRGAADPTRIYAKSILGLLRRGRARQGDGAHHRRWDHREPRPLLPKTCDASVVLGSWSVPRVIEVAVEAAGLSEAEALKTFNMGIGFALVLGAKDAAKAAALLAECGERVFEIGEIVEGSGKVVYR